MIMKIRNIAGVVLFVAGSLSFSSCDDETNYTIATENIITTVETGSASVTAVSAQTTGRVLDLSQSETSSYSVGVVFGTGEDPTITGTKQVGTVDSEGVVTTNITGLQKGTTYYYATFVTLQGKVTKYGTVNSFVTTDATIVTAAASDVSACKATLHATANGLGGLVSDDAAMTFGFKLSTSESDVNNGIDYPVSSTSTTVTGQVEGLLPGTTYYYVSYFQLGDGYVYGETQQFTTSTQEMEYVDLGLSVLWAKYNLGAESESESGILLGYGDLTGVNRSAYVVDYSPAADISGTANDIFLQVSIDGSTGKQSTTPTQAQMEELIANTTQTETMVNNVAGVRFTAANGNSIFMPYVGYRDGNAVTGAGTEGIYWSGTNYASAPDYSHTLKLSSGGAVSGMSKRSLGAALRSVRQSSSVAITDASKILFINKDGNGTDARIEIYNEYGATKNNCGIAVEQINFKKNMVVTFKLAGITGNLKSGATGSYIAGLQFADADWSVGHWSPNTGTQYDATINGDGTYSVWMETGGAEAVGAVVFCIDIPKLWGDLSDSSKASVELVSIKMDVDSIPSKSAAKRTWTSLKK